MEQNKHRTAVEQLQLIYESRPGYETFLLDDEFEEAREREVQQMKFMFDCGRQFQLTGEGTFKEVYEELYGTE